MNHYKEVTNHDLFYCYSRELSDFIYQSTALQPLTIAINPKSRKTFSLYVKSERLQEALDAYRKIINNQ